MAGWHPGKWVSVTRKQGTKGCNGVAELSTGVWGCPFSENQGSLYRGLDQQRLQQWACSPGRTRLQSATMWQRGAVALIIQFDSQVSLLNVKAEKRSVKSVEIPALGDSVYAEEA